MQNQGFGKKLPKSRYAPGAPNPHALFQEAIRYEDVETQSDEGEVQGVFSEPPKLS